MASLKGKVIAITGAGSGIARATARVLFDRGASLSLADINGKAVEEAAKEILESVAGGAGADTEQKITTATVDVRKSAEVNAWIEQTVADHGKLDGAANLAGVVTTNALLQDTSDEDWEFVMGVNATGIWNCLRAELNHITSPGGSIVNAASVCGMRGYSLMSPYIASKHAVVGLTRVAGKEAGPRGIRVNCIAPGVVDTPMTQGDFLKRVPVTNDVIPLKRKAAPEEIGKLVAFLLSDDASYINAAVHQIDAGLVS